MRLLKAQHYHITLCLEWETLRNFYSLIVNEQWMLLDNVSINVFETLLYSSLATMICIGCVPIWIRIYDARSLQGSWCIKGTIASF